MTKTASPAGFKIRFLAIVIDISIMIGVRRFLDLILTGLFRRLAILVFLGGYFPYFTLYFQATLGKMILGLKVVSQDRKKLVFFQVLLREWIGKLFSCLVLFLGFAWVIFDRKKQGWHDKIAQTLAVTQAP
ncbi:MAG: RDD family protein [Candidatus Pacebacteria bacterium]|nr:RDD family protein [Candidatus Paceibacterota bacterium]